MTLPATVEHPLRLLLVEDSKGDAILIERVLKNAMLGDVTIERKATLEEALQSLAEHEFDVVLLDRSLPDTVEFSGLHSVQNLSPKVPVIFLTAYQDEQTALQAIMEGAQDYLFKDKFDTHIIKRAIQYAVLRKQFEGILITRANYDMLTGLANRMLFENRVRNCIAKMRRQQGNASILFMDLDRFKQVNDSHGHTVGDQLLKDVGTRIRQVLRPYDTAARFGGDEFAVLLEGGQDANSAELVAKKLIAQIDTPFEIEGRSIRIGVSIGIVAFHGNEGESCEDLLLQSDAAMYKAKSLVGSSFFHYSESACAIPALEELRA